MASRMASGTREARPPYSPRPTSTSISAEAMKAAIGDKVYAAETVLAWLKPRTTSRK